MYSEAFDHRYRRDAGSGWSGSWSYVQIMNPVLGTEPENALSLRTKLGKLHWLSHLLLMTQMLLPYYALFFISLSLEM